MLNRVKFCILVLGLFIFLIVQIKDHTESEPIKYFPPPKSNEFSKGLGENGVPVIIDVEKLTKEERLEYETSSVNITANAFISDRISVRRYLPDRRHELCNRTFGDLPDTSVIITFHNELYSMLLRTIHSVIDRSPPHLLREVILVDDASDYDYINGKLQNYLRNFDKVKLIRLKSRSGLIKARLAGIKVATGETLTFLDSHVECLTGWLEPLLEQIKIDKRRVAEPQLPNTSKDDFHIDGTELSHTGTFNWRLDFIWAVPWSEFDRNGGVYFKPVRNIVLVGGVFTIHSDFFSSLGYWDEGLEMYGYENMELTFKAWMCHGSVWKVPCSIVAHVFHNRKTGNWKLKGKVLKRNLDRVAEVWMDDYKEFVYQNTGPRSEDLGDISHLLELRARNECHNFEWFMRNVVPHFVDPKQSVLRDVVRSIALQDLCLITGPGEILVGYPCTRPSAEENILTFSTSVWDLTKEGHMCTENNCVYYNPNNGNLMVYTVNTGGPMEEFSYDPIEKMIKLVKLKTCLEIDGTKISTKPCNVTSVNQKWAWGFD